jgi:hypothetical protein
MINKMAGRISLSVIVLTVIFGMVMVWHLNAQHETFHRHEIGLTEVKHDASFSPNNDGVNDVMSFEAFFTGPHNKLVFAALFVKKDGRMFAFKNGMAEFSKEGKADIRLNWDGKDFHGRTVADGKYSLVMYYFDIPGLHKRLGHRKMDKNWQEIENYLLHKKGHELLKRWDGEVLVNTGSPVPTVNFSVAPETILLGETSTLTWTSANAASVSIDNGIGSVALNGLKGVTPTVTTVYTITASGPGGTAAASVTVTVNTFPLPTAGLIVSPSSIIIGESATLSWTSTNADTASIDNGIGAVAPSGSITVTPAQTTVYIITVSGPGGTVSASATITVVTNPAPNVTFNASPTSIEPGGTATLSWTSEYAESASIDNGIGTVAVNGSLSISPVQTTTYTITVTGPGGTSSASVLLRVVYPAPSVTISSEPASIDPGGSTTLSWSSTEADTATIDNGIGSVNTSGSVSVTPTVTTVYTITVTGKGGTATATATVIVVHPNPTVTITANPQSILPGQSSTLTWETTNATTAVIDQEIGVVAVNGSLTVTPALATTYTITATGPAGSVAASVTVTISPLRISITSPAAGTAINRPDTIVEGTIVNNTGKETGLTVNGIPAFIDGNQFVANHVPLVSGENTITADARDIDGNSASLSIIVTADTTQSYITLSAGSKTGVSPLETLLSMDGSFPVTGPQLNFSGPGQVEFLSNSEEGFKVRMSTTGVYYFTASAVDETGTSYTDTVAVQVLDKTVLDTLLKSKWNGMKAAMANGDIETAISYFSLETSESFRDIFATISTRLPQIAAGMQEIEPVYFPQGSAKYRIKRDELVQGTNYSVSFYIYFFIDYDGIWKIYRF